MKKIICGILILILSFSLCACDKMEAVLEKLDEPKPKTFTVENLTIDLNDDFFRMDALARNLDFCISSEDVVIGGTRVDLQEHELTGVSVWDYAEAFREAMAEETMTEVADLGGFPTMSYTTYDDDGEQQTAFIALYEASDCFWLVQYIFETEDYDELYPLVEQYALSVKCQ